MKLELILAKGLMAQFDKMLVVREQEYLGAERFLRSGQQFIGRTFAFVDAQIDLEVRVGRLSRVWTWRLRCQEKYRGERAIELPVGRVQVYQRLPHGKTTSARSQSAR